MSEKLNPSEAQRKRLAELLGIAVWELELLLEEVNNLPEGAPVGTIARRPDGQYVGVRVGVQWVYTYVDLHNEHVAGDWPDADTADSWPVIYDPTEGEAAETPETAKLLREMRDRYEAGEGPHPLSRWANGGSDPTAQQEPAESAFRSAGMTFETGPRPDLSTAPKPRTPRVVDRLGVDEQGSRWVLNDNGALPVWEYEFDDGHWYRIEPEGDRFKLPAGVTPESSSGFLEILEPEPTDF